eukprot:scaffold82207_cov31-Tisochrysis_lutea.AAC.1
MVRCSFTAEHYGREEEDVYQRIARWCDVDGEHTAFASLKHVIAHKSSIYVDEQGRIEKYWQCYRWP